MELEFFSAAFLSALFAIVLIDLVLAGDNALIIGLVARNLPQDQQRKVIFWGTFGAIATRALMAISTAATAITTEMPSRRVRRASESEANCIASARGSPKPAIARCSASLRFSEGAAAAASRR